MKLGLILGLLAPVIAIAIMYVFKYNDISLTEYLNFVLRPQILAFLITLFVFPNLGLFFLFIWKNFLLSARGVLFATFIYAFIIIGLKYIL
jgi:hypothetical protein